MRERRPLVRRLIVAAFVWSVGLIVVSLLVPVYGTDSDVSVGSAPAEQPDTLYEVNGAGSVALMASPGFVTVVTWLLLARTSQAAWLPIGALGAVAVLALMSIGVFLIPVVLLLLWAAAAGLGERGSARWDADNS
jgi:hypothetical protein